MKKITLHLGLDVHKETITIATAEGRRSGEVRVYGTISNDLHAIEPKPRERRRWTDRVSARRVPKRDRRHQPIRDLPRPHRHYSHDGRRDNAVSDFGLFISCGVRMN
ncbi:MAG TPA: hypothetical protein VIT21_09925 [Chthoniobacterales bacterium]